MKWTTHTIYVRNAAICILLISILCGSATTASRQALIDVHHSRESANPEVNMVTITKLLEEFSFEVKDEMLTEDLLEEYDVVILHEPHKELENSEIEALTVFVQKGGGLILCGDRDIGWNEDSRSAYNQLGSTFGITFAVNSVDDPTDKRGCYCTPIIHNLAEHPITEGVSQIVLYYPCSLLISENAVAIARGDEDTRGIGQDRISGEDIVVAAVSEYGKGRVVALGSHTVFHDSFINQPDNQSFSVNCFHWVSAGADTASEGGLITTVSTIMVIAGVLLILSFLKKRHE